MQSRITATLANGFAGAIYNPARDDPFIATQRRGAFLNGEPVTVSDRRRLDQSVIGCGFYYDCGEMMRATLAAIESCFAAHIHGIRHFGTVSFDLSWWDAAISTR